ncbi:MULTISPECIES: hypothetical protein [Chitinophaga]|uniref:Uncharacterized protein n=1 Tax=Chitinophaga arvensicola TaxID=29529 RepID=A0A1I0S7U5_9BACT|nr:MULTISPECIES: hypothetical protein [Chitinophaga]MDQ0108485.1 anion-transporting ArsA/GET3 family ATPase [Chitinophaga terrae (ex Kim and Jung 2007)]SEW51879.1 hypothetical protein SAMN04488122_4560 [Chitinophaga arvensicola]
MSTKLKISKELEKQFNEFLEYHPAKRVNRSLREVFMTYASYSLNVVPLNMEEIIWDMQSLMELFDMAEDETKDWPEK